MVKPTTIKVAFTLDITHKWDIQQVDSNNVFHNDYLHKEVYMTQPPSFMSSDKTLVCKLHKAIYGLKQAIRDW